MVKDFRNIEILVGDTVAYPGRHGSSVWMNCGHVLSVSDINPAEPAQIRVLRSSGRIVTLTALKNVCVVARAVVAGHLDQLTAVDKHVIKETIASKGTVSAMILVRGLVPSCSILEAKKYVETL